MASVLWESTGSAVPSKTHWIVCNGCGADAFQELSTFDGWHIGRCRRCSLVYVNPMPFFVPSKEFSQMSLQFQYTRFQFNITQAILDHDRRQMRHQLDIVGQLFNGVCRAGRLLDIGCGSGAAVRGAADLGWSAIGIDIDPALVELGRNELHVDLLCGTLPNDSLEGNRFHFCRLRDVIEHLPNPYEVLLEVYRLLVPGGVVLVATPNDAALPTQIRRRFGFGRNEIATVVPPHHVHGFVSDTLARILCRCGFRIRQLNTTTPIDPLYVTARNMTSKQVLRNLMWRVGETSGKGSMLIAWAQKPCLSN